MPAPEELFTKTFVRIQRAWGVITSFRQVAEAGLPQAEQVLSKQHLIAAKYFLTEKEYDRIFFDKEGFLKSMGGIEGFARSLTGLAIKNSRNSVDAASLVFTHSLVDDVATSLCEVTAAVAPKDWEKYLDEAAVQLKDVRDVSYEKLRETALQKRIKQLRFDPLLNEDRSSTRIGETGARLCRDSGLQV